MPERRLLLRKSDSFAGIFPICVGTVPEIRLPNRSRKDWSDVNRPSCVGIVPEMVLLLSARRERAWRCDNFGGTVPEMRFQYISTYVVSLRSSPIDCGSVPERELTRRTNMPRSWRSSVPSSFGMVPDIAVSLMAKFCDRLVRPS